jgi:hypothetical protein
MFEIADVHHHSPTMANGGQVFVRDHVVDLAFGQRQVGRSLFDIQEVARREIADVERFFNGALTSGWLVREREDRILLPVLASTSY